MWKKHDKLYLVFRIITLKNRFPLIVYDLSHDYLTLIIILLDWLNIYSANQSYSGPYFPAFGLNNSEYGHFSRSDDLCIASIFKT